MEGELKIELWGASWCGPCKNIKKELAGWRRGDPIPAGGSGVRRHLEPWLSKIVERDAEESMNEAQSLGINSIPHWELYYNGNRVNHGFMSAGELAAAISELK